MATKQSKCGMGKGMGKDRGPARNRKVLKPTIEGVTKPALKRLARRGGVKRMSGDIYEVSRALIKVFLETIVKDAVVYTQHARRKTVTANDVVHALRRNGRELYGYGN